MRRQQAQEETEARQLGVELLKPGDRAELVMGTEGIMSMKSGDKIEEEEDRDFKRRSSCDHIDAVQQGSYFK